MTRRGSSATHKRHHLDQIDAARAAVTKACKNLKHYKGVHFANGRDVCKLLEKSMEKQEMRIRSSSDDHNLSKLEE
jgi:hypothetical protein|tara:strand:- start:322 stop:549 length:228 start_codon:yes stop_codon:yes gene_type:complete